MSIGYANSNIYNSVERVQAYWNSFKPEGNIPEDYIAKWVAQSELYKSISLQNRTCITLWDVVSGQFVYAVDETHVLGDNASRFTEPDGVHFSMSHFPPTHINAAMLLQETAIKYCLSHPEYVTKIVMSQDLPYNCKGQTIHIIQQVMVVEADKNNHPLLFMSFLYDISHLKKSGTASLVITHPEETLLWTYNFNRNSLDLVSPFTKQERKILTLLGEGKNTRQISELLFLSPHTIDTHRRSLLHKSNCVDTTALVTYCRLVGLL